MRRSFLPKEAWKLVARVWWFGRASSGSIRVYPHKPATLLCRQIPKGTPPMFPERVHPIFHSSLDIIPFLSGESRAQTDDRQRYQAGTTSYNYTILRVDFGSNRYIYILFSYGSVMSHRWHFLVQLYPQFSPKAARKNSQSPLHPV